MGVLIFMKKILLSFTKIEAFLLLFSIFTITATFFAFDGENVLAMIASLVGVIAIIFCAKGNPIGQALFILFGLMYGYISITYAYWGEMLTYLGMSVPMSIYSLVTWLKHPYTSSDLSEVKINTISKKDIILLFPLTVTVTVAFYFILKYLGTSNLLVSTFSVSTSFAAVYLTSKRCPYYALAYALNDLVLIVLWVLASINDSSYVSVAACFSVFLLNDIYGFFNWLKMKKIQEN